MTPQTTHDLLRYLLHRITIDARTGCWTWTRACSQSGWRAVWYPVVRVGRTLYRVNRLTLLLHQAQAHPPQEGESPVAWVARVNALYAGQEASHTCDHSRCVNPHHLTWLSFFFRIR